MTPGKELNPANLPSRVMKFLDDRTIQKALYAAATPILNQAIDNAPKLEGTLRASGAIVHTGGNPRSVTIVFDTPYAARQHEELGYTHKYGGPKYLERAYRSEADTATQVLATTIKGLLK